MIAPLNQYCSST